MKKRYLVILFAVIAAALLLVLPGTALAAGEKTIGPIDLSNQQSTTYVDLNSGAVVSESDVNEDIGLFCDTSGGQYVYSWGRTGQGTAYALPEENAGLSYATVIWNDVPNLVYTAWADDPALSDMVIVTRGSNSVYKVKFTTTDYPAAPAVTITYEPLLPPSGNVGDLGRNWYMDLDTGAVNDSGGNDLWLEDMDLGILLQAVGQGVTAGYLSPSKPYSAIGWSDVSALVSDPDGMLDLSAPFVVRTDQGNYYKVEVLGTYDGGNASNGFHFGWAGYCFFLYEKLPPTNPPTMLNALKGFIATPTVGTINPTVGKVLTAEVKLASAALAQQHPKAAVLVLKAVVMEVKALPAKKISADAAASIISQANAIIAAINQ